MASYRSSPPCVVFLSVFMNVFSRVSTLSVLPGGNHGGRRERQDSQSPENSGRNLHIIIHKNTHIRTHTHTHKYTYTHTHIHSQSPKNNGRNSHIIIHTQTHTNTHTYTHTHTYTYMHTLTVAKE